MKKPLYKDPDVLAGIWAIVWIWMSFFVGALIGIDFAKLQWWYIPYAFTCVFILIYGMIVILYKNP